MAATTSMVQVHSAQELESAVTNYVALGFAVSNRTPDSVVMYKRKEFNVVWAIVGLVLCLLPLLIYLVVYAVERDQMVEIRLAGPDSGASAQVGTGTSDPRMSDDRHYWWDGSSWRSAEQEAPPNARRSDDGHYWWDGTEWRPVPATEPPSSSTAETGLWAPPEPD
jgi:hypothetical protein